MSMNQKFLDVLKLSFKTYLEKDSSRSTAKLKSLHGFVAKNLLNKLGGDYTVQSQGYGNDKEGSITGRYYNKNVDIVVNYQGIPVAGYAVKFVMRNYSQNSNNYFENMLGETANIRSKRIPYFQVFISFEDVPYYKKGGDLKKYDHLTNHHITKYLELSKDNPDNFFHTPDKTLFILLSLKNYGGQNFKTSKQYALHYLSKIKDKDLIKYSTRIKDDFDNSVILNNFEDFIDRSISIIKGKGKSK